MYIVLGVFILITAILNGFFFNKMYVKIVTKKNKKIHGWDIFITKSQINELTNQLENMLKYMIDKGY